MNPIYWLSVIGFFVGMLGALVLYYKRYPDRDWIVLGCLGFVSLGAPGYHLSDFFPVGVWFNPSFQSLTLVLLTGVEIYLGWRFYHRDDPERKKNAV